MRLCFWMPKLSPAGPPSEAISGLHLSPFSAFRHSSWGLRETDRQDRIGGQFLIWSRAFVGTEIALSAPRSYRFSGSAESLGGVAPEAYSANGPPKSGSRDRKRGRIQVGRKWRCDSVRRASFSSANRGLGPSGVPTPVHSSESF